MQANQYSAFRMDPPDPIAALYKSASWGQANPLGSGTYAPDVDFLAEQAARGVGVPAITGAAGEGGGLFESILGKNFLSSTKDGVTTQGWGGQALGVGQSLLGAYMGMKQYGIAKDTLEEGKRQFQLNYDAQKTTTNSALQDRQRARVASNPGAYVSVGEYMNQNGIK